MTASGIAAEQLEPAPTAAPRAGATPRGRRLADRAAALVASAGGLAVIGSLLGILVFLLLEVAPLFRGARAVRAPVVPLDAAPAALLLDEHATHAARLDGSGRLRIERMDGTLALERDLAAGFPPPAPVPTGAAALADPPWIVLGASDGRALLVPVEWRTRFLANRRETEPAVGEPIAVPLDPSGRAVVRVALAAQDDRTTVAGVLADGTLALAEIRPSENAFTGESSSEVRQRSLSAPVEIRALALAPDARRLYAAGPGGELLAWSLDPSDPLATVSPGGGAPIESLAVLLGGRSLLAGDAQGTITVYYPPGELAGKSGFTAVRRFAGPGGAITALAPGQRDRSFLAAGERGRAGLYFSTSHRTLLEIDAGVGAGVALALAARGDRALVAGRDAWVHLALESPHPEVSVAALTRRVWYERHPGPAFVWQSTGGTDDFEPKLSLVPLVFGTLKGTVYSLLLALPLAILGAMYTSQFMHPSLQRLVKPTVELMASLPSVVLGLLAGLFLAPRLESSFPALLLLLIGLPGLALLAGWSWSRLPRRVSGRLPDGGEVLFYGVILAAGIGVAFALGPALERALFDGSFPIWLERTTGLRYEQRNAIVIAIAMGFAVIPIVFSIAEDSFTSVPSGLAAASLALGATRWQTVTRIVLPAASPGLFAATMIGFGRAVGETMIVLMATGNTPVLDASPWSGFRTLSANIAVEIPEAPHGGSLYRVLFLSALLLFSITFAINTVSELVRERLRARYART
jgi:phosphate transport system permease protein